MPHRILRHHLACKLNIFRRIEMNNNNGKVVLMALVYLIGAIGFVMMIPILPENFSRESTVTGATGALILLVAIFIGRIMYNGNKVFFSNNTLLTIYLCFPMIGIFSSSAFFLLGTLQFITSLDINAGIQALSGLGADLLCIYAARAILMHKLGEEQK